MRTKDTYIHDALLIEALARLDDDDLLDLVVEYEDDEDKPDGYGLLMAEAGLRFNKEEDGDDEDGAVYYECSCKNGKPVWTKIGGETEAVRSADKEA